MEDLLNKTGRAKDLSFIIDMACTGALHIWFHLTQCDAKRSASLFLLQVRTAGPRAIY